MKRVLLAGYCCASSLWLSTRQIASVGSHRTGTRPSSRFLSALPTLRITAVAARPLQAGRHSVSHRARRSRSSAGRDHPLRPSQCDLRGPHTTERKSSAFAQSLLAESRRLHEGVPITSGTRLVLAGFVDLRAPLAVVSSLATQLERAGESDASCSTCREFYRPHLTCNIRLLERASGGRRGSALLRQIARRRVPLPHVNLEPLARGCSDFLAGKCNRLDGATHLFVARVLALEASIY